ncbi:MAG TPA: DNA polymerase Y family protein [Myxococcota bacterium]|jgi:protein ImuB|nr:DNA polymerase Y family protein [Myxococcota bacterium]
MRIACLRVREFPTDALAPDESPDRPVAALRGEGTHTRVAALNEAARAHGVRREMNPSQARARCAGLVLVRWDAARVRAAEQALYEALHARCSPRVAPAGRAGEGCGAFWLDATGMGARAGGERAWAASVRAAAVGLGHQRTGIGLAGSAVAAGIAARLAGTDVSAGAEARTGTGAGLVHVVPGGDVAFLASRPIAWLPIGGEVRQGIASLGISRIGELAALPLGGVGARFGPAGVEAWRLAHAIDVRGPLTPPPSSQVIEEVDLLVDAPAPVTQIEPLLFVLRGMMARFEARLTSQGLAAATLDLVLGHETGGEGETRHRLRPARATAQARALWELCRITLEERAGAAAGVASLRLETVELVKAPREQGDLWQARWFDPAAAEAVLARLRARLGEDAVVEAVTADAHRPEARGRFEPLKTFAPMATPTPGARSSSAEKEERLKWALRLYEEPRTVEVTCDEDVPATVGGQEVVEAWGPERLSGEWWTGRPFDRVYWRVATDRDEWLWIFQEPAGAGPFFLHGWWD